VAKNHTNTEKVFISNVMSRVSFAEDENLDADGVTWE